MEYLVYFKPNKELSDLILSQKGIVLPDSGLHSAICFYNMESYHEVCLKYELSKIDFSSFRIEAGGFETSDDGSLVLRLSRPEELLELHHEVISVVKKYAEKDFAKIASQYYGDNYSPHITISKSSSDFDMTSKAFMRKKDYIFQFHLAIKSDSNWKEIQTVYSQDAA